MSNKTRFTIWAVFATASIIIGIANKGFKDTWPMLLFFFCLALGYEVINYFVIKKRQ